MQKGKVTERTFYPALIDVIENAGGTGIQEVMFNSVPGTQYGMRKEINKNSKVP